MKKYRYTVDVTEVREYKTSVIATCENDAIAQAQQHVDNGDFKHSIIKTSYDVTNFDTKYDR